MKFRTMKRHLREGFKSIYRNGWMTVASVGAVTVTLILVAVFLAVILNLNEVANKIESDVEIRVLIDRTANEEEVTELRDEISRVEGVEQILFASKDDELESLVDSMGEEGQAWLLFEQDNPLHHAYIVRSGSPDDIEKIAMEIEEFDNVAEINYGKDFVERLFTFNKYARNIGLVLVVALVLTAIFLISNTIKITIMARSTEIGIMKLVGATNGFIRWPFFIEGMLLGILGSVIPIGIIMTGYHYLDSSIRAQITFNFFDLLPFDPFAWQLSFIILVIGTFIGMWGSVMSVRKFLKV
ncbi:MAG TPA: permease-like cell division protein FtsX [Candidatus Dormibacteraeota bacterium]|nr:permease-like cell division protein FtsX [Candidatus Dormibacteraeota bacterium]